MSNADTTANIDRHAENFAGWLATATANLVAQGRAAGLEGDDLIAAVRAALLDAVGGK